MIPLKRITAGFIVAWVFALLVQIAVVTGIGYVVWHFIAKVW